jgi:single-stranded DNA-binding protein
MHASINRCILLGAISERGVEVSYHGQGTAKASFMLIITEQGSDGKAHQLWQPVEIWGKRAEQVGELEAGAVVLVEGKLKRVKKGEAWETVVSGFEVQLLRLAMPVEKGQP